MKLKKTILGPILVALFAFVSGGWLLQRGVAAPGAPADDRVLLEIVERLSRDYVDTHEREDLYRMAVEGLLKELGDPHTSFMSAEDYNKLRVQTTGEYGGLGIQIAERDDARYRPKDLFLGDPHVRFHIGENGRLDEPALGVVTFLETVAAARERRFVDLLADADVPEDLLHRVFMDHRPDIGFWI